MQTTTTFTKLIEMQFARDGKRTKLVGFIGQLTDESGIVLHSALYDTKAAAEIALDALVRELLIDYAERGLVDELPEAVQCDICDNDRVIRADNGRTSPCPYCSTPITIGQRFSHLGFGTGTVIAITDAEHLNVQVKFDSPSRFGSKFWFDASEVTRARADDDVPTDNPDIDSTPGTYGPQQAVTRQSRKIEQTMRQNRICKNCGDPHFGWQCPAIRARLFAPAPWSDPELGKVLCRMRWLRFTEFKALLSSLSHEHLLVYAASYQAFIRTYAPDTDLTISQVLHAWGKVIGPAAPAMLERAA